MREELRLFFTALQFFTRVPVPAWVGFEPAWLQAGDVVTLGIDGLGEQSQKVVRDK